jgi:ribonuclease HII
VGIYQYDETYRNKGYHVIAGIDEAGRGPLAGPVVAAAVILPSSVRIKGLKDSKKISTSRMPHLFFEVLCRSTDIGIGIVDHDVIDRLNILRSTRRAMQKAVDDLTGSPDFLIIDAVKLTSVPIEQVSPVKAESKSASVAAASIVAKYVRDSIMNSYHRLYPVYNFRKHKGYCTMEHLEMLRSYGPCPIHRKSFKKVMTVALPFR